MEPDRTAPSWEEAVRWYRRTASTEDVRANYFDLPVLAAAKRYARSREFSTVHHILAAAPGRVALDLGAGNGIAAYALATRGWSVHAVEPDPSDEVGAGAISAMASAEALDIAVYTGRGESLSLANGSIAAVHARQVLHHLRDLPAGMREIKRVLVPGGFALCTREHVADTPGQLEQFLQSHPLHHRYGGEHAYALREYLDAATGAGLVVERTWSQLRTPINAHPLGEVARHLAQFRRLGRTLRCAPSTAGSRHPIRALAGAADAADQTPGRLYAFLLRKP